MEDKLKIALPDKYEALFSDENIPQPPSPAHDQIATSDPKPPSGSSQQGPSEDPEQPLLTFSDHSAEPLLIEPISAMPLDIAAADQQMSESTSDHNDQTEGTKSVEEKIAADTEISEKPSDAPGQSEDAQIEMVLQLIQDSLVQPDDIVAAPAQEIQMAENSEAATEALEMCRTTSPSVEDRLTSIEATQASMNYTLADLSASVAQLVQDKLKIALPDKYEALFSDENIPQPPSPAHDQIATSDPKPPSGSSQQGPSEDPEQPLIPFSDHSAEPLLIEPISAMPLDIAAADQQMSESTSDHNDQTEGTKSVEEKIAADTEISEKPSDAPGQSEDAQIEMVLQLIQDSLVQPDDIVAAPAQEIQMAENSEAATEALEMCRTTSPSVEDRLTSIEATQASMNYTLADLSASVAQLVQKMSTKAFEFDGAKFVTNNYAAVLTNDEAPSEFHLIQDYLAHSEFMYALTQPEVISPAQVLTLWRSARYNDGGEHGSPSLTCTYEGQEYLITPETVRKALHLPEHSKYHSVVSTQTLKDMMQFFGYSGSTDKMGELKRPLPIHDTDTELPFKITKRAFTDLMKKDSKKAQLPVFAIPVTVQDKLKQAMPEKYDPIFSDENIPSSSHQPQYVPSSGPSQKGELRSSKLPSKPSPPPRKRRFLQKISDSDSDLEDVPTPLVSKPRKKIKPTSTITDLTVDPPQESMVNPLEMVTVSDHLMVEPQSAVPLTTSSEHTPEADIPMSENIPELEDLLPQPPATDIPSSGTTPEEHVSTPKAHVPTPAEHVSTPEIAQENLIPVEDFKKSDSDSSGKGKNVIDGVPSEKKTEPELTLAQIPEPINQNLASDTAQAKNMKEDQLKPTEVKATWIKSTSDKAQVDTVELKKKSLFGSLGTGQYKESSLFTQIRNKGTRGKEARDTTGLGHKKEKIQTSAATVFRDPYPLTEKAGEVVTQKDLDKIESNEATKRWSERLKRTIQEKRRFYGISSESEYVPKIVKEDGSEINMEKNSSVMETIAGTRILGYNNEADRPGAIQLGEAMKRCKIEEDLITQFVKESY
nr:PREDICTED: nucleolar and coiled-body phosphoprotein 1-like [Daucus carota subsp. sativus]